MELKNISAEKVFSVFVVSAIDQSFEVLYTLDGTHYGRLLLIFRVNGEIENFRNYAQQSLKSGLEIKTVLIIADNLEQVHGELEKLSLLPKGPSRIAVEGTSFFDEIIAQLMTGTLWDDKRSPRS